MQMEIFKVIRTDFLTEWRNLQLGFTPMDFIAEFTSLLALQLAALVLFRSFICWIPISRFLLLNFLFLTGCCCRRKTKQDSRKLWTLPTRCQHSRQLDNRFLHLFHLPLPFIYLCVSLFRLCEDGLVRHKMEQHTISWEDADRSDGNSTQQYGKSDVLQLPLRRSGSSSVVHQRRQLVQKYFFLSFPFLLLLQLLIFHFFFLFCALNVFCVFWTAIHWFLRSVSGDHHDNWKSTSGIIQSLIGIGKYSGPGAWVSLSASLCRVPVIHLGLLSEWSRLSDDRRCWLWWNDSRNEVSRNDSFGIQNRVLHMGNHFSSSHRRHWCQKYVSHPDRHPAEQGTHCSQPSNCPGWFSILNSTFQDSLGISGDHLGSWHCHGTKDVCQIWGKPLSDGSWVAGLYNADDRRHSITLDFSLVNMKSKKVSVRDLWNHRDLGTFQGNYTATEIKSHDTVVLKLTPQSNI